MTWPKTHKSDCSCFACSGVRQKQTQELEKLKEAEEELNRRRLGLASGIAGGRAGFGEG